VHAAMFHTRVVSDGSKPSQPMFVSQMASVCRLCKGNLHTKHFFKLSIR